MKEKIEIIENYNLTRLQKYLNYELSSAVLFAASFLFGGIVFLLIAAAAVFTPFILYVLYQENRKGWIISFFIMVCVPLVSFIVLSFFSSYGSLYILIALGLFYFYCFLLRFEVNNWVQDDMAKRQYLIEKKQREEEMKAFMSNYEK
jgi:hypothetical protein